MEVTDALTEIRRQIQQAETELGRLRQVEESLVFVLGQGSGQSTWIGLRRVSAVMKVLREAPAPLSPSEIAGVLQEKGRQETSRQVSESLKYLRSQDRVEMPPDQWGKWRPTKQTTPPLEGNGAV